LHLFSVNELNYVFWKKQHSLIKVWTIKLNTISYLVSYIILRIQTLDCLLNLYDFSHAYLKIIKMDTLFFKTFFVHLPYYILKLWLRTEGWKILAGRNSFSLDSIFFVTLSLQYLILILNNFRYYNILH